MNRRDTKVIVNASIKQRVFDYKILGLDPVKAISGTESEAAKNTASSFTDVQQSIQREIETQLHRDLYGNLSREEADRILRKYSTVQEGMKHIPGATSEMEYQQSKAQIVNAILEKLDALKKQGEAQRIFTSDYAEIRTGFLQMLFKQFGCHLDMELFHSTVDKLHQMDIIPNDVTHEQMIHLCPIRRWF